MRNLWSGYLSLPKEWDSYSIKMYKNDLHKLCRHSKSKICILSYNNKSLHKVLYALLASKISIATTK